MTPASPRGGGRAPLALALRLGRGLGLGQGPLFWLAQAGEVEAGAAAAGRAVRAPHPPGALCQQRGPRAQQGLQLQRRRRRQGWMGQGPAAAGAPGGRPSWSEVSAVQAEGNGGPAMLRTGRMALPTPGAA